MLTSIPASRPCLNDPDMKLCFLLEFDHSAAGRGGFGGLDLEHAVLERGGDGVGVDVRGKLKDTRHWPTVMLALKVLSAGLEVVRVRPRGNGQHVRGGFDDNFAGLEP